MELIKVAYAGRKPFNDKRHGSYTEWQPGDEKLITPMAAKQLLKYAEFSRAKTEPIEVDGDAAPAGQASTEPAQQQTTQTDQAAQEEQQRAAALAVIEAEKVAKAREDQAREDMLLAVSNWDKDQLKDYAAKYDVKLNKTHALQSLREQVSTLVDQFGVR